MFFDNEKFKCFDMGEHCRALLQEAGTKPLFEKPLPRRHGAVAFWRPPLGNDFGQWSCPRTPPDCTPGLPSSVMEVFCHCCHLPCTAGVSASARRQRQQCKEVGSERAGSLVVVAALQITAPL